MEALDNIITYHKGWPILEWVIKVSKSRKQIKLLPRVNLSVNLECLLTLNLSEMINQNCLQFPRISTIPIDRSASYRMIILMITHL